MRYFYLFLLVITALSCRPDEEKFSLDSSAVLRFSTDTVYFDTLFSSLGSATKRFRIYNDAEKALNISNIKLSNGSTSPFTIYVNGLAGPTLENIRILGKDSILVLAEVTIDPRNEALPFIVTDQISFTTNGNNQKVNLVAWGQDANFLRDSVVACNATWTAEKPYVLYNSIFIDKDCSLTIEAGTKIYSHNGSFILIQGTIVVDGTADNRVLFSNDRFDEEFTNAPGQWGGLIFLQGSKDNHIDFSDIRNAQVGIYLGTPDADNDPDLILSNTRIENMGGNTKIPTIDSLIQPGYGILAFTSDLYAYNVLVNNCEISLLGNFAGGNYRYEHCTFANFNFDFFRKDPALVFSDNIKLGDGSVLLADLNASIRNSIIWGSFDDELVLFESGETNFNFSLSNSILKNKAETFGGNGNFLNKDPKFFNPGAYNYTLDTLSPAKDVAPSIGILNDMNGNVRDAFPDMGAFERKEN